MRVILSFIITVISGLTVYAQNISVNLEKNISETKARAKYISVDKIELKKGNLSSSYRIKLEYTNTSDQDISALLLKYSYKLRLIKDNKIFDTISLYSGESRISQVKKSKTKKVYIYNIKYLKSEILNFYKHGYKTDKIIFEVMKEPKPNDMELCISSYTFQVVDR